MIEYHRRQVPLIIQTRAEAVFWYAQLAISVCERADTIPYSDQHTVALLISSLSWSQHTFFCIRQSVLIRCQHFWRIFFNVFFIDQAIVGHIVT